jgi:hypothetical protein
MSPLIISLYETGEAKGIWARCGKHYDGQMPRFEISQDEYLVAEVMTS